MVYITVRYGENQHEIFNPNCKTYILMKTIRQKCKCDREADIELSDESGNIKNLRDPGLQLRYATEFLDEREKLILLQVEKPGHEGAHLMYKPLLQAGDAVLNADFLARLALKGSEQHEFKRVKSSTRRRRDAAAAAADNSKDHKDHHRQISRERQNEKSKHGSKADKRMSAKSKR